MELVNVYDLKWNFLRAYWIGRGWARTKPLGFWWKEGKEIHKLMTC